MSSNNPVNDMKALMCGRIDEFDKVIKNKSSQSLFCWRLHGLSKWIFMSTTRQNCPERQFV